MISEKFLSQSPNSFLESIEELQNSRILNFICDFEYNDFKKHENSLLCVGQFHDLDKVWPKKEKTAFFSLHQKEAWPKVQQEVFLLLHQFLIEQLIVKIHDEAVDNFFIDKEHELLNKLTPFFLSSCSGEELLKILKTEAKAIGAESIEFVENNRDLARLESFVLDDNFLNEGKELFVPNLKEESILRLRFKDEQKDRASLVLILYRILNANNQLEVDEEIFSEEYPVAILNDSQEVFFSNYSFMQFNIELNKLSNLKNGDLIGAGDLNYMLLLIEDLPVTQKLQAYLFIPLQSQKKEILNQSSEEELGIICSSIAHELNNPIGGIINAFQLLQILNDFDEGTNDIIEEMSKSIKRAHRLVNLFLGFVRTDIQKKQDVEFDRCLNQAVDLLRGRMVKEGCFVNVVFKSRPEPSKNFFNESILTIIFYIILSESMTLFARATLVKETKGFEKALNVDASIGNGKLTLDFIGLKGVSKLIEKSHFLQYLLNSQDIKINQEEEELVFSWH